MATLTITLDEAAKALEMSGKLPAIIEKTQAKDDHIVLTVRAGFVSIHVSCSIAGYTDGKLQVRLQSAFSAHRLVKLFANDGVEMEGDVLSLKVPHLFFHNAVRLTSVSQRGNEIIAQAAFE